MKRIQFNPESVLLFEKITAKASTCKSISFLFGKNVVFIGHLISNMSPFKAYVNKYIVDKFAFRYKIRKQRF